MHKILFIVDGSLDRPLLHSQGIPLLKRLANLGHSCWILSFESSDAPLNQTLSRELAEHGVRWKPVTSGSGRSNLDRVRMVLIGFFAAFRLCKKEGIEIVHSRSYRPAVIANLLKSLLHIGFLFDMRGFLIDEQIMLGRWKATGLKNRIARYLEKSCLLNADAIVTTSPQFSQRVIRIPYIRKSKQESAVISIPNCADTSKFCPDQKTRERIRQKKNWQDRRVITFTGEARAWEGFGHMINFYKMMREIDPAAFLALLVYGDLISLQRLIESSDLASEDYCIMSVQSQEVSAYLAASDIGLMFRKENPFTQEIASPIKFAEYLSSGLPTVINPGVGDTGRIIDQYRVGVVVDPTDSSKLYKAAVAVISMLHNDPDINQRCHNTAEKELSLDFALQEYLKVYDLVAERRAKQTEQSEKFPW